LDANYVPLKTSKSKSAAPYLYPQSLVKQLKLNKQPKYKKNDFLMIINNSSDLKNNELRSILTHEIIHGLGFMSLAPVGRVTDSDVVSIDNSLGQLIYNETDKYIIFPYTVASYSKKLLDITDEEEYMKQLYNTKLSKFMPFSIFDKYIVSLESGKRLFEDLKFYYKEVSKKCLPKKGSSLLLKDSSDKNLGECFDSLSSKTKNIITSNIKKYYFKAHSLSIVTKDGEKVPLQTLEGSYASGSSVVHPNNPLYDLLFSKIKENGPDAIYDFINVSTEKFKNELVEEYYDDNYVLYFSDDDNFTVEEMLKLLPNNPDHPLIGNGIVKVMKTLGWNEKGKRRSSKTYYLDESFNIPESNSFEYIFKKRYEISKHDAPSNETVIETTSVSPVDEIPTLPIEPTSLTDEVKTSLPAEEEKPTFPADDVETSLPVEEEEPTFPADEEINEEDILSPIDEVETSLPVEEEEEQTFPADEEINEEDILSPIDEVETSLPVEEEEEQTFPADDVETTYPIEDEEDIPSPIDEVETSLPVEEEEEQTYPADEVETTYPVEDEAINEVETSSSVDKFETILPEDEENVNETIITVDEIETIIPLTKEELEEEKPTLPVDEEKVEEEMPTSPVDEEKIDAVEATPTKNPIIIFIQKVKKFFESLFH